MFHICTKEQVNYSSGYFILHIFGKQLGRHKILDQIVAGIPQVQSARNFFMNTVLTCFSVVPKYFNFATL